MTAYAKFNPAAKASRFDRDARIRGLWDRMTAEQHDRAWARLTELQRVDAIRACLDGTYMPGDAIGEAVS